MKKIVITVLVGLALASVVFAVYRYTQKDQVNVSPTSKEEFNESINEPTLTAGESGKSSSAPTNIEANFSKKGAVFAREDGWKFLWDEPGQLALNVKLKFTDQSICYLGGEKKDCGLINMGPQSYDYVSLEGKRDNGEVTVIRLEELKLPQ